MSHAGSGLSRLIVGGSRPRDIASAVATTPAAPLAPCGWPIIDFVDEPGTRSAMRAEDAPDAARLDGVVQLRRGAVIVDVSDLLAVGGPTCAAPSRCSERSPRRPDPSARGGRHRTSSRSLRSAHSRSLRARARDPRARARASTRPRRARIRRGRDRTAATPPRADRYSGSTRRACARSRRSSPAAHSRRCRPTTSRRARPIE